MNTDITIKKTLSLKQYDIAETIISNFDYIDKLPAIKFIKSIFGSTAELSDISKAYNAIEW